MCVFRSGSGSGSVTAVRSRPHAKRISDATQASGAGAKNMEELLAQMHVLGQCAVACQADGRTDILAIDRAVSARLHRSACKRSGVPCVCACACACACVRACVRVRA